MYGPQTPWGGVGVGVGVWLCGSVDVRGVADEAEK